MYDYAEIKELAKERECDVKDLLVLSPKNDPFYVGSAGQREKALWIKSVYDKMGRPSQVHIRRMHYWLVSQTIAKPDGTRYMNTEQDWDFVTVCSKYARYLNMIPIENVIDKRNPAPIVNTRFWSDEVPTETKETVDADEIIDAITDKFYCFNAHNTQPYVLEMWCEKSTMNDVLDPLAQKYGCNLVTGLGELSITAVHSLMNRIEESGKPVRIFYISDFDPAGECMPVSVARKLEYFMRQSESEADVKLVPLMLTSKQCRKFKLPRTPIKATEGRKDGFEDRHGAGATELDALEAIYPGEMRKMIEAKIQEYMDIKAWNKVRQMNDKLRATVKEFLIDKIGNVLEDLDLSEYDAFKAPKGEEIDDSDTDWLYDSNRDYEEQLERYKEHRTQTGD